MDHTNHNRSKRSPYDFRANIVLIGFLFIAGFYLVTEHRVTSWGGFPGRKSSPAH